MKTFRSATPGPITARRRHALALTAAALALGLGSATPALAQADKGAYPERPVRMLIGFAPGGPTDVVGRAFAARLSKELGQSVIVDNKPGASTTIATSEVVRAKPDGYTIYFTGTASLTITPLTMPSITFDVARDLVPVALPAAERFSIGVNPEVPAKNLKELAELAKANPGKYKFANSGTGNIGHLTAELFAQLAGKVDMPPVPYKGAAPAMQDLLAGHVQVLASGVGTMYQYHQTGKLRVLAITDTTRSSVATEIPTAAESGFPDLIATSAFVVLVPAGTPEPIVNRLNAAFNTLQKDEGLLRDLRAATVEVLPASTPASSRAFIESELRKWSDLVKNNNIKLN